MIEYCPKCSRPLNSAGHCIDCDNIARLSSQQAKMEANIDRQFVCIRCGKFLNDNNGCPDCSKNKEQEIPEWLKDPRVSDLVRLSEMWGMALQISLVPVFADAGAAEEGEDGKEPD